MEYINLDQWRLLKEDLFKSYIRCYELLSKGEEDEPAKSMVRSLTEFGILMKVTEADYSSFYTIARELGIYYQYSNDKFILSDLSKKYLEGNITYSDYLKHYILNTEFLINNEIVHPFEEIAINLISGPLSIDNLAQKCTKSIPVSKRSDNATGKLKTFIRRAIDASLIFYSDDKYSLAKPFNLLQRCITKSNMSKYDFEEQFVGTAKGKQENIVKNMINRAVANEIYDGNEIGSNPPLANSIDDKNNFPLNQILFGPPGTGKTYSTITKALNIIGLLPEKDSYTKKEYEAAQELFQNELGKRIEFVTMHQSFSYEDFVQGLKPKKSSDSINITFDYKNGVFKEICKRAFNCKSGDDSLDSEISLTNKEILIIAFFLSKFNGKRKAEKMANEHLKYISDSVAMYEIAQKIGYNSNSLKNLRDKFDFMFKDRDGYTARTGWNPRNDNGGLDNTPLWPLQESYDELNIISFEELSKIVDELLKRKKGQIVNKEGNYNHVIILDEINRANISRVFGELIALIEEDKRDGKLSCTLPSGETPPFTVPSNLYIIGTMNTADKSIALVDIALRRRFNFIPLFPDKERLKSVLEENKIEQKEIETRVNLMTNLNKIIRSKKSVDFEIGHSYFMENDTLTNILNNQVLPLLNEYFMYDLRKVKEIIEKTQKDKEGNNIPKLGITLNQVIWKDRGLLEVESIDTEAELLEDALDEADENNSDS